MEIITPAEVTATVRLSLIETVVLRNLLFTHLLVWEDINDSEGTLDKQRRLHASLCDLADKLIKAEEGPE